jgi:hypothetical protein
MKAAPVEEDATPCGSVLNPCFETQPTSHLHKGPPITSRFTHANEGPMSVTLFYLGP